MFPVRCVLLSCLLALPMAAQTVTPANMGGGCGGTVGYPFLGVGNQLFFYLQRPGCSSSSWAFPTGLIMDVQPPRISLPFVPGLAPGCVIVMPTVYVSGGAVGVTGSYLFVADLGQVPTPITVYLQGVANCTGAGRLDTGFSDAWQLRIQ